MTLANFIKENREELDRCIKSAGGTYFNDEERRQWVYNDEDLYLWARREGVSI